MACYLLPKAITLAVAATASVYDHRSVCAGTSEAKGLLDALPAARQIVRGHALQQWWSHPRRILSHRSIGSAAKRKRKKNTSMFTKPNLSVWNKESWIEWKHILSFWKECLVIIASIPQIPLIHPENRRLNRKRFHDFLIGKSNFGNESYFETIRNQKN